MFLSLANLEKHVKIKLQRGVILKTYGKIDSFKKMNIKVILNDTDVLYEGRVDDAPADIKDMRYTKALLGKVTEIYVYQDNNKEQ